MIFGVGLHDFSTKNSLIRTKFIGHCTWWFIKTNNRPVKHLKLDIYSDCTV